MQAERIEIGAALPRRRSALLAGLGRVILRLAGWRLDIAIPDEPRLLVILAPHTSNWDFVFGMAALLRLELPVHWFGKHTLFAPPFGALMRKLGGIAIDRSSGSGVVAQSAAAFTNSQQLLIGLAPEGTRSRVEKWKRGFYHIAREAQVPVLVAYIDYRRKCIGTGPLMRPTGDWDADMREIFAFYRGVTARHPALFATE